MPEPVDTRRKVSVELREQLLRALDAPEGSVVVARRPTAADDIIEVRMNSASVVPAARRPETFEGFHVDYQVVQIPKAGKW